MGVSSRSELPSFFLSIVYFAKEYGTTGKCSLE
jgi:hypothetical protein